MTKLNKNQKKIIIFELTNKKKSQRNLAKKFNVSRSCIQKIYRERNVEKNNNRLNDKRIEEGCINIFEELRSHNIPVSGPMLQTAAKHFADIYKIKNFKVFKEI